MAKITRQQLPWFKTLRVGVVLISGKGMARIVRGIYYFKDGDLKGVNFAIKRCSWTKRPYTNLNFTDLRRQEYRPAGIRIRLDTTLDKQLAAEIEWENERKLTCCMVKGIA